AEVALHESDLFELQEKPVNRRLWHHCLIGEIGERLRFVGRGNGLKQTRGLLDRGDFAVSLVVYFFHHGSPKSGSACRFSLSLSRRPRDRLRGAPQRLN